jgi:hypothetical protein
MPDVAIAVDDDDVRAVLAQFPTDGAADYAPADDHYSHDEFSMLSSSR